MGALMATLASAQDLEGAVSDGIVTIEQALSINPEERSHRSEMFRIRGELRLKQEQPELARADFREAIAVACNMNAIIRIARDHESCATTCEGESSRRGAHHARRDLQLVHRRLRHRRRERRQGVAR